MTHDEIVSMCYATLKAKATEYATAKDRWHNFYEASNQTQQFTRFYNNPDHMDRMTGPVARCLDCAGAFAPVSKFNRICPTCRGLEIHKAKLAEKIA